MSSAIAIRCTAVSALLVLGSTAVACSSAPPSTELAASPGSVTPGSGGILDGGESAGWDAGLGRAADASVPPGSPPAPGTDASAPSAPACPGAATWSPGDSKTISIAFGDAGLRSYDIYVGTGVKAGTPTPLVVNMHGLTNSPAIQAQFSQMNPVADTNGFIVAYPAGIGASFNAGACCGTASTQKIDDVGFVRAVVADVEANICVDAKRVYETGFSNGGMMAYVLACEASDIFAAVAPTEGDNQRTAPCAPSRPVPVGAFEYLGDPVIVAASAQKSLEAWATQVGCTDSTPPETAQAGFSCQEWSQCSGGAKVQYCTLPGGTHYPPVGSAPLVWSFLSQFALP